MAFAFAVLLAAPLHFSVAAGVGPAFGIAGAHAELRWNHLAAYAGYGDDLAVDPAAGAVATGARAFWFSNGDGPFLSLDAAWSNNHLDFGAGEYADIHDLLLGGAVGMRLLHESGFFYEFGLGIMTERTRRNGWGPVSPHAFSTEDRKVLPDFDLAVGFEF